MRTLTPIATLVPLLALIGCARTSPLPPSTSRPAYLLARDAHLMADGAKLVGRVQQHRYDLALAPDGVQGLTPAGDIQVQLSALLPHGYEVRGRWNGSPALFSIGEEELHGTGLRQPDQQIPGAQACRYDVVRMTERPAYAVYEQCPGTLTHQPTRFELRPSARLDDPRTAFLLIAYLLGPRAPR